MKKNIPILIIILICLLLFSFKYGKEDTYTEEKYNKSNDSIVGVYIQYVIKLGEFVYDPQTEIEYYNLLASPDTNFIHTLIINTDNKFVETYQIMHSYKEKSLYRELLGTWSFSSDTLTLNYEKELRYNDKTKTKLIDSLSSDNINGKYEQLILVFGIKLWEANNTTSSLNLLKQ